MTSSVRVWVLGLARPVEPAVSWARASAAWASQRWSLWGMGAPGAVCPLATLCRPGASLSGLRSLCPYDVGVLAGC
jgi:hypothetical protein